MNKQQFILNVERCQRAVRRFLTALCSGDSMLADDLAQESFIKAYLAIDSMGDEDKFDAWIYRIAYNTFISNKRKNKYFEPIYVAEKVASLEQSDNLFENQELYVALSQLTPKECYALLLFYMEGYNINEIAEITDCSVAAVKQQLSRGRHHLKKLLKDE